MGFLSAFVRGQTCMWALARVWRREADTTSCVADYLTRSVRRASGFVLVGKPEVGKVRPGILSHVRRLETCHSCPSGQAQTITGKSSYAFAVSDCRSWEAGRSRRPSVCPSRLPCWTDAVFSFSPADWAMAF